MTSIRDQLLLLVLATAALWAIFSWCCRKLHMNRLPNQLLRWFLRSLKRLLLWALKLAWLVIFPLVLSLVSTFKQRWRSRRRRSPAGR